MDVLKFINAFDLSALIVNEVDAKESEYADHWQHTDIDAGS